VLIDCCECNEQMRIHNFQALRALADREAIERQLYIANIVVIILLLSRLGAAQDMASLTGTVRDKNGAVLPRATVVVKNPSIGLTRSLVTKCGRPSLPRSSAFGNSGTMLVST
jgi:hypothetical protein